MDIYGFDHVGLIVKDIDKSIEFYTKIMGFQLYTYGDENRKGLIFGINKINLTQLADIDKISKPRAQNPTPGSSSLCFITNKPLKVIMLFLQENKIEIIAGPKRHTGATKLLISIHIRDPDGNLIQIANNVT